MEQNPQKPNPDEFKKLNMLSFATELGFIIALPLVALALIGKWLDGKYHTDPWLTVSGILASIALTTYWITKRIKTYMK